MPDLPRILRVVIQADPPPRLDKALARDVPEAEVLSRSRLARMIGAGKISRNGEALTDQKTRVHAGDEIEVVLETAAESHMAPENIPLDIRYDDAHLIVVNKPAGMVVHPAPGTPSGTLVNALLAHTGEKLSGVGGEKRPGVVHRIDKGTSGLLVVAKTDAAHQGLAAQFEAHKVERRYKAICHGCPDTGDPRLRGVKGVSFEPGNRIKIATRLARHKTDRQRQAVLFSGGRHAVTRCRVVKPLGVPAVAALLDCWLETGRTHQIRVHLAHAGHGLIGDPTYGGNRRLSVKSVGEAAAAAARSFPRQALHAAILGFTHPVGGENLQFEAELPSDMADLLAVLSPS
jgi:23S rRNA pseudouridine1911/1915/1917 synthase